MKNYYDSKRIKFPDIVSDSKTENRLTNYVLGGLIGALFLVSGVSIYSERAKNNNESKRITSAYAEAVNAGRHSEAEQLRERASDLYRRTTNDPREGIGNISDSNREDIDKIRKK